MAVSATRRRLIGRAGALLSTAFALTLAASAITPGEALADEDGVSFWLPGLYGSLAAAPQKPGWSMATMYYHPELDGGGNVAASRLVRIGNLDRNVEISLDVSTAARPDLIAAFPTYTFKSPVLGGQLSTGLGIVAGYNDVSIDGTLTLRVGDAIVTRQGSISDSRWGFGDLFSQISLRWNRGASNYMVYGTGDIPVGTYDPDRLANFGIGHGAIDGGVGYTYLNPKNGHELSAVTGLTYNFENEDTDYKNGVDWHLDWGASQFLSPKLHIGLVGYMYQQISADEGQAAFLGENKSRVMGVGPQIGYLFPVGGAQGYLNLKGYGEFDAANRADGWNLWLTFVVSPGGHEG
jgi:hypothetical protein